MAGSMFEAINLPLILLAHVLASASPGPATLAIAGTSMQSGRSHGAALAMGVLSGSVSWSIAAALGLGAIMAAHVWLFEIFRYVAAAYLLYLAIKSARACFSAKASALQPHKVSSHKSAFLRGFALHLTNPKAVLFFGSLYLIGIPTDAPVNAIVLVVGSLAIQSAIIFVGYAMIFSSRSMVELYKKSNRLFNALFAVGFGAAGLKILTTRLD